jgi:hypothetical protein
MTDVSALAVTAISILGELVIYQPAAEGAPPVTLKAIVLSGEQVQGAVPGARLRTDGLSCDVLVAQLAQPAAGDEVTTARGTFHVRAWRHADPDALVWRLDATPAAA